MRPEVEKFRNGIFKMPPRKFGEMSEFLIRHLYDLEESKSKYYDATDPRTGDRVEIKFSRAMCEHTEKLTSRNLVDLCILYDQPRAILRHEEVLDGEVNFDCNIQQVKCAEFDVLYYGIFTEKRILIYRMDSAQVKNCKNYSDKHHKGNVGEGQFHLNRSTIQSHEDNLIQSLKYGDFYDKFNKNL